MLCYNFEAESLGRCEEVWGKVKRNMLSIIKVILSSRETRIITWESDLKSCYTPHPEFLSRSWCRESKSAISYEFNKWIDFDWRDLRKWQPVREYSDSSTNSLLTLGLDVLSSKSPALPFWITSMLNSVVYLFSELPLTLAYWFG